MDNPLQVTCGMWVAHGISTIHCVMLGLTYAMPNQCGSWANLAIITYNIYSNHDHVGLVYIMPNQYRSWVYLVITMYNEHSFQN